MADTASEVIGGRYRVLGSLGKGAMGLVFMAYDPVLDRKVAIKQMTAEIADNEELRQRFYVEARAAARLNHPNIITIHELQESGGDIFMIMELLEGKSLAALIQAKPVPLSIEATLDVMAQVCDGLDYAHQRTIVHRDIKPANLFLTPSGAMKILDFGIARLGSLHMTAAGALIGTPDYMSPEQIRGDEIDRRTDLWAVGAVLYQLLSGTKPFEGKPLSRLLSAIAQNPHVPLQQRVPSVPKSVSDLVDRLLAKPRDGRPASAALVRDELRAILGRESAASTRATLAEDEYEETVFMSVPSKPQASPAKPAAPAPAVAPVPPSVGEVEQTVMMSPAAGKPAAAPVRAPAPPVPVVAKPAAPAAVPPPLPVRPASPPPAPRAAAPPAPPVPTAAVPRAKPAAAAAIAPPVAAAPAAKTSSTRVVAVAVAIVGLLGLTVAGAAAWWYFRGTPPAAGEPAASQAAAPAATERAATTASQPAAETRPTSSVAATVEPPAQRTEPSSAPPAGQAAPPATTATGVEPPRAAPATPPVAALPPTPAATPPPANAGRTTTTPAAAAPARRAGEAGVETGVAPGAAARPGVSADTLDAFKGRTSSGQGSDSAATLAAVNRINYVLEQYVRALVNADAEVIRDYRASLSPEESALMRARQLKVRLDDVRVEVNGTDAVARCRRRVDGTSATGTSIREDGTVTFHLTRKPAGWVITDVR